MLISLNWLRDYVDLPADIDPHEFAERVTRTTAEVEGVSPINVQAKGVIAARIVSLSSIPETSKVRLAVLDVGNGKTVETVTGAPALADGANVVYAPDGSSVAAYGTIKSTKVSGHRSSGMILPGSAVGISLAAGDAVFLDAEFKPGEPLPPDLFEDWTIEIDNKSITHRPDLWGCYGMAREIAAIFGLPLEPYPVVPLEELTATESPEIPISIADAEACRRYTGLLLTGVPTQPAPLWMQLRLGHIGLRPISGLVDLTNYIMADLSQPMHAFDAGNVDRIEVDWAKEGETFRTLDDVERKLTSKELMIQCHGRSIAIAGVMGGGDTEVHEGTRSLLLESANFEPATIRRTATRMGMRTDASARFEKSLDPENTVLAIQRFVELARPMYANMKLAGRLSDCFPRPPAATTVSVDPRHVSRTMGRPISLEAADKLLAPLGFTTEADDSMWRVRVPSFRAANDVSIEADIIEEIARYVGYDTIEPEMPRVSMRRFAPHALHELEQRTLEYFTSVQRFNEIHGYLWYDGHWLAKLAADPGPCVTLKNPASDGMERMRRDLLPGMLAAVAKNRFYFPAFSMIEVASVFEPDEGGDHEFRHLGLVSARHGKKNEEALYDRLKGAIEGWAWQRFSQSVHFTQAAPEARKPWEHPHRTAVVVIGDEAVGRVSVVDLTLRRLMDEHLASWSVVWAELRLSGMARQDRRAESLGRIPAYPLVEVDVSFQVPLDARYADIAVQLASFTHPLLKSVRYVGSYQGGSLAADRRSITVRAVIGDDTRTLVDDDAGGFRTALNRHLSTCGYEIRGT